MRYHEYPPHESLRDYLKCFWILEKEYTPEDPWEEVTPDACIELIFNFGAQYTLQTEGGADREMPPVFLIGVQKKPLLFRSNDTVRILSTRFYSWGVLPFVPFQQHAPQSVGITLDHDWYQLAEKLKPMACAERYDSAIAMLEDFLIRKLLTETFDLKQIQVAAQMLYHEKGQFKVSELAEYCSLSVRQLQRQFQDVTGI
jgi:AraC-like DNA-binding protein